MDNENTVAKTTAEQPALAERTRSGCCYRPNVDILEQGDELLVLADVPGASSDTIDVKFEDGKLEIQAAVAPRQSDGHDVPAAGIRRGRLLSEFPSERGDRRRQDLGPVRRRRADAASAEGRGPQAAEDRRRRQVKHRGRVRACTHARHFPAVSRACKHAPYVVSVAERIWRRFDAIELDKK